MKRKQQSRAEEDQEDLQALVHDLKNIIMGACGNLTLLRSQELCDPKFREAVQRVENMLLEAGYLARTVLTEPDLDGNAEEERLSVLDLVETTAAVCIAKPNIRFQCSWNEPLPLLSGKMLPLKRVLRDLFTNAVEELSEGGEIRVRLYPVEYKEGSSGAGSHGIACLGLEVSDTGKGIPSTARTTIFDKGFTTRKEGSGMGLYSARKRISRLNGHFDLISEPGQGAVFRIVLPATNDLDPRTTQEGSFAARTAERVLLVDDDLMIRQIVVQMLEHMGVEVQSTESADEAVRTYQDALQDGRRYDLVIIDLNLGDETGGETVAAGIRKFDKDAYLVVTTGWDRDPRIQHYKEYGFSACLRKPFTLEELKNIVAQSAKKGSSPE